MTQQQFGVIELAAFGKELALDIESRGYSVSVFSNSTDKTEEFIRMEASGKSIVGKYTIVEFVDSLKRPRNILITAESIRLSNQMIHSLRPFLQKGDVLIDGGNKVPRILFI